MVCKFHLLSNILSDCLDKIRGT